MSQKINRRNFVKTTAATMATAAGMSMIPELVRAEGEQPFVVKREIPIGDLAGMKLSRMIIGGNLLTHYAHPRDLRYVNRLAKHYNTPQKIAETLHIAREHGINGALIHTHETVYEWIRAYRSQNIDFKFILSPLAPLTDDMAEYTQCCQEAVEAGADSLYVWGVQSDTLLERPDVIKKAVATIKSFGIPAGVGAHLSGVIELCEKEKVKCDYYVKTLHTRDYPSANIDFDNSWCDDPEHVVDIMSRVEKPWLAFKVMAAGGIPPRKALEYTFTNGADFTAFGMFDFEIDEDTRMLNEVLEQNHIKNRARKWFG